TTLVLSGRQAGCRSRFQTLIRSQLFISLFKDFVMKIAVLSRDTTLYSTKRLVEAAKQRGHHVRVLDHLHCFMDISSDQPSIHYRDYEFTPKDFDAVIPRIGASVTFYGAAVVRQFEMMGVYSVNESVAITRARDKLRSLQLLSRKKVGIPVTAF